ncbi:Type I phosphoribosyltransferase [Candidatus Bealeia paramacronuclearis]|uniref:Type I phosphoribosyltransferase n=1 Tax=Candidatus Bealeia paramacronuclearis TaxID=1921001 RepID=A0ABZ2C1U4_9PROT|nr:Type I phosphoribosyltransferase [Candidatus Bealeia paramacronuclearis]
MSGSDHRFYVTWEEFYRDARALGWRLKDTAKWRGMIAITRGGLVPSAIVAREIGVRLIDTLCIASYGDEDDQQVDAETLKIPQIDHDGEGWLIIDDLSDTGKTAKIARRLFPKAHIAAIYAKPLGKDAIDSYMTEVSQDTWIVFPWEE